MHKIMACRAHCYSVHYDCGELYSRYTQRIMCGNVAYKGHVKAVCQPYRSQAHLHEKENAINLPNVYKKKAYKLRLPCSPSPQNRIQHIRLIMTAGK